MTQWAKCFLNKYGNLCLHFQGPWKRLGVVMKDSDESPRLADKGGQWVLQPASLGSELQVW